MKRIRVCLKDNNDKKVIVSTNWIKKPDVDEGRIFLDLSLQKIQMQKRFLKEKYVDRKYEDVIDGLVLSKKEEQ